MKYITAYYRQQGEETPSLLLQQFVYRGVPVCFACLQTRKEETKGIKEWVRSFSWEKAIKKPERWLTKARGELEKLFPFPEKSMFVLAVGEWILLSAATDGQGMYQVNSNFGRGVAQSMKDNFLGVIEPEVGVLLNISAREIVDEEKIREEKIGKVLCPGELRNDEQVEKRLQELGGTSFFLFARENGRE